MRRKRSARSAGNEEWVAREIMRMRNEGRTMSGEGERAE